MHFILASDCIAKFDNLRRDYQKIKGVNLSETPSIIGLPTFFGGTDVKNRNKQISFMEKMKFVVQRFLLKEEDIKTEQQWQANLMASRIMVAVGLYVQAKSGSSSELYKLINKYLKITTENFMDDKDRETFYRTAYLLTNQLDVLISLNEQLIKDGNKEFSFEETEEWEAFSSFIAEAERKRNTPKIPYNKYPVTTLIQPVFQGAFAYVGTTIGWVVAEAVSNSSVSITPKLQLTSVVTSLGGLLIIGRSGAVGVALLAPTIASQLLSGLCTSTFADMSGWIFGWIGKGTAVLVGIPFDLTYNLLKSAGSLITSNSTHTLTYAPVDGIRIGDGVFMAKGNPVQFNLVSQNRLNSAFMKMLQLTEEGEIFLGGELVEDPDNKIVRLIINTEEQIITNESSSTVEEVMEEDEHLSLSPK